jgi:hypothetical protein
VSPTMCGVSGGLWFRIADCDECLLGGDTLCAPTQVAYAEPNVLLLPSLPNELHLNKIWPWLFSDSVYRLDIDTVGLGVVVFILVFNERPFKGRSSSCTICLQS